MPSYAEIFQVDTATMTPEQIEVLMEKVKRYSDFKTKAIDKAEEEFYTKKERLKIKLKMNANIPAMEYDEMEQLLEQQKELKKASDPKYAVFITVNPEKSTIKDFEALDSKVKKCLEKHWITDYAYCYEQRSNDVNDIHGLHTHILLKRELKPSHTEREIRSTFKSLVGIPQKHINIQYKKKDWIKDKIEYMLGKKTGEGKEEKTQIDKQMRKILGIEDIYYSEECSFNS